MTNGQAASLTSKLIDGSLKPAAGAAGRVSKRPIVSPEAVEAGIRSVARRDLLPLAIALGLYFLLSSIGNALLLGDEPEWALSATSAASAAICFLIAVLAFHSSIPASLAHSTTALLATLTLLNFLAPSVDSGNLPETLELMALLIGSGAVFLSWEWLAVICLMTWGAWLLMIQLGGSDEFVRPFVGPLWQSPQGTALGAATLAACLAFVLRHRYVANTQRMRLVRLKQNDANPPADRSAERRAEFLPSFAEQTSDATISYEHGRILDASHRLTKLLGYEPAQLAGRNLLDLFPKDSRNHLGTAFRLGSFKPFETVALRQDGSTVPVEIESRTGSGIRPTVRVLVINDISERARVAEDRQELERINRCEMALAGMDISFDQPNELPVFLNQIAALATLMLSASGGAFILLRDAATGKLALAPETTLETGNEAAANRLARLEGPTRWIIENGQPLFISRAKNDPFWREAELIRDGIDAYAGLPLLADGEKLGILYVIEQTPRTYQPAERNFLASLANRAAIAILRIRMFEQMRSTNQLLEFQRAELQLKNLELAEAKEFAENASRAKSDFLSTISHELRTPMNGVLGMLSLLHTTELTAEQSEFIGTAQSSADGLLSIINEILDFSRIESGQLRLKYVSFEPASFFKRSVEAFAILGREKGLPIHLQMADDLPASLEGDPERLRQIVSILVRNAIKYTERGEITVRLAGRFLDPQNYELHLEVSDTGIGIAPEIRPKLFLPFSQADGSLTRVYGGVGLGLAIAKQLVTLMHGQIGVESTPGKGATFRLSAPLQITGAA